MAHKLRKRSAPFHGHAAYGLVNVSTHNISTIEAAMLTDPTGEVEKASLTANKVVKEGGCPHLHTIIHDCSYQSRT